jgi:RNA polymerase sigma-70 factor (ECF subfamily)
MAPSPQLRSVPAVTPPSELAGFFRAYSGYVATIAVRILGRDDEVDDVVQDVFLDALSGLRTMHTPESIKSWLGTIAVRKASYRLRRRRLRSFIGLADPPCAELPAPGVSPEEQALLQRVYRALDCLPVAERVVWILRHIEGEQLEDVAQLAGCSLATAKRRLLAAHQAIERIFHERRSRP